MSTSITMTTNMIAIASTITSTSITIMIMTTSTIITKTSVRWDRPDTPTSRYRKALPWYLLPAPYLSH